MDADYNAEKAVDAFEARREVELANEKIVHMDGWEDRVEILKLENPSCWRMTKATKEGTEKQGMVEEFQLHIQGILEDKRVPPIRGEISYGKPFYMAFKHARYCNEASSKALHHMGTHFRLFITDFGEPPPSVVHTSSCDSEGSSILLSRSHHLTTLSGINSTRFMEDVEHIMDVVALFARHVSGIQQTGITQVGEKTVIEVGNRIFTPKHEAPAMRPVEVDRLVDENGYIAQVNRVDSGFVYGDENVVYYGEEKTDEDGGKGDIVDVGFSIMGIGRGRDTKARLVLRSVTLLDATHTQAWLKQKAKNQLRVRNIGPVLTVRKRPGQEDDEDKDTRKRMTRMKIREGDGVKTAILRSSCSVAEEEGEMYGRRDCDK
ncbi:hypothetical protein C8R42DRAFT_646710 [Lentinula raphanica]|nr:hypothetical protein C8R42DRAFT_646710 [Lentinula raphanica]